LGLVGEIGFNAGLSSWAMLESDPDVQVVSFDLGLHRTVPRAKQLIDEAFPGRHTLVVGDSTQAVPAYAAQNPGVRFDLVFIDGGHDYEIAAADLQNMRKLSGPNTVVVMDDVMPWRVWGQGPTKAWEEAIRSGVVVQDEVFKDGRLVDHAEAPGKRAWAVGRYL
jgi:predicted O-methyltransferase YrrM